MSSKFAGLVGPILFGLLGQFTGSSRVGILSVMAFFIIGAVLLRTVREQEGIAVAREENAAAGLGWHRAKIEPASIEPPRREGRQEKLT